MPATMWIRDAENPILPVIPGTWRHSRVANCSLLIRGDTAYLYYRAGIGVWWQGAIGHEAIGLATCPLDGFDGIWVGDIARVGDTYYLWYEGRGAGIDRNREYAPGGFSQIGLATLDAAGFARLVHDFNRM